MNTWLGTYGTDAYYNGNWSQNRRPETMDEVRFDGAVSQVNCVGLYRADDVAWDVNNDPMPPRMGEGSYDKIRFINGYTGSVSLGTNLMVYTLELTTGNLDQGYNGGYGTAISVVTRFDWTGGTLNSTEDLSSITLEPGSTAAIAPGEGNTLVTGSSILLADASGSYLDGAVATFTEGELILENGSGISVGQECILNLETEPEGLIEFDGDLEQTSAGILVNISGKMKVYGEGTWAGKKVPINIDGGELSVELYTTADVTGRVGGGSTGKTIEMSSGKIVLYMDATLKAEHGLLTSGGTVATILSDEDQAPNVLDVSYIEGNWTNDGASVVMFENATTTRMVTLDIVNSIKYSKLQVTGDIDWWAGDYSPVVYGPGGGDTKCDLWYCTGTFRIYECASVTARAVSNTGALGATPQNGSWWTIIEAATALSLVDETNPALISDWGAAWMTPMPAKKLQVRTPIS